MAKKLDPHEASAAREDARRLEAEADVGEPYPDGTVISRPSQASRMFNVRSRTNSSLQSKRSPRASTCRCPRWPERGSWTDSTRNSARPDGRHRPLGKTPVCITWCPRGDMAHTHTAM